MSMVVAHPVVGTVIATDLRHTAIIQPEGDMFRADLGGKLMRTDTGWVAAGGMRYGRHPDRVFKRLANVALHDHRAIVAALQEVGNPARGRYNIFTAADTGFVGGFSMDADRPYRDVWSRHTCLEAPPPAAEAEYARNRGASLAAMRASRTLPELIRVIARDFAWCAQRTDEMSSVMEVGSGELFLRCDATELARMTDDEIVARTEAPPAPVERPFTRMLDEPAVRARLRELEIEELTL